MGESYNENLRLWMLSLQNVWEYLFLLNVLPYVVSHVLHEVVLVDHRVQLEQDVVGGAPVPDSGQALQMTGPGS